MEAGAGVGIESPAGLQGERLGCKYAVVDVRPRWYALTLGAL
jgi:hypothetical protein